MLTLPMRRTKARPASSSATQASNDGAHSSRARTVVAKVYAALAEVAPADPPFPGLASFVDAVFERLEPPPQQR